MNRIIPCVLMRAGTSRGPFFLRNWLPADDAARDQALIGAIGASDPLQLDGVGGGSTLNSKVAIVSRSSQPGCDVDYLFAQVGVGQRSVDTRPNCGNMLSGVVPFAIEQGLIEAREGTTTARVFNVNTGARIDVTVQTPGRRITYEGSARIDGVAGTAAPIHLDFLDAWGAVTGQVFPTGRRIDVIDGVEVTCIDAAMPLMIVRARDLGQTGRESPVELDADHVLLTRLESLRRTAGRMMGLGDVSNSVIPKPVLVSPGEGADDRGDRITSRYFTPRRCHASHAVTGAIGVASAFALPGTVASGVDTVEGRRAIAVLHPAGRIDLEVEITGPGDAAQIRRASLVRTARKILQGELHIPGYVFSKPDDERLVQARVASERTERAAAEGAAEGIAFPSGAVTIVVPTAAGGGNDVMARAAADKLASRWGRPIAIDNRAGASGAIARDFVARAAPDGHTLMLGYIAPHGTALASRSAAADAVPDFEPVALVGRSPTLMVANNNVNVTDVKELVARLKADPDRYAYASAGDGTAPHFAAELFKLRSGTALRGVRYEGAAPAIADTVSGEVQLMFPSLLTAAPFIKAGRLRVLAVAGRERVPSLPHVPTLEEAGVEGVDVTQWYAVFAPAGTPAAIVRALNQAFNEVLSDREVICRMKDRGVDIHTGSPEELRAMLSDELSKWRALVREAKLEAD